MWFVISNNCSVQSHVVGENKETNEEHVEDCVEERYQLTRVKFDRDGYGCKETLRIGYLSISI